MKKWFCMHVPMMVSRVVALEVDENDKALTPDVRQAARNLRNDTLDGLYELELDSPVDAWVDSERLIGLSEPLGDSTDNETRECDGCETYYEFEGYPYK